jgi:hypothetical protein
VSRYRLCTQFCALSQPFCGDFVILHAARSWPRRIGGCRGVDRSSPARVALTAALLYAAWAGWAHHIGRDWRGWAAIGRHFVTASDASRVIARDAPHATNVLGYDGQFFLYWRVTQPALARVSTTTRAWMWLPTIAWFAPWYTLLPLAFDAHR